MAEFEQRKRLIEDTREHPNFEIKHAFNKIENMEIKISEIGQLVTKNLKEQLVQNNAIMQDAIISSVKAIIKEEVHLAMRDQPDRFLKFS